MWLLSVKPSTKQDKKYTATFCKCEKKNACKGTNHILVDFGQKGGSTYIDHKDQKKKDAYLARHKANENWNDPTTAGSLAKNLLWGATTSLKKNIELFKKKFRL